MWWLVGCGCVTFSRDRRERECFFGRGYPMLFEDFLDRVDAGIHEWNRATANVIVLLRVDAQRLVNRREQAARVHLLRDHLVPLVVGLAVDRTALNAAARDRRTPRTRRSGRGPGSPLMLGVRPNSERVTIITSSSSPRSFRSSISVDMT